VSLDDLRAILLTRKQIAENLDQPFLNEIVKGSLIRFNYQSGKYILGFVQDVINQKSLQQAQGGDSQR